MMSTDESTPDERQKNASPANGGESEEPQAIPEGMVVTKLNVREKGSDTCPRCASENIKLTNLTQEMQLALMQVSFKDSQNTAVCSECFKIYKIGIYDKKFLDEKNAEITGRTPELWNSRIEHVKKGRALQMKGDYLQAGAEFEEYIRILEVCFDVPKGGLNPEIFREQAKIDELKTLSLVLWELVKVYDGKDEALCAKAGDDLAKFIQFTTLKATLLERVGQYQTRAISKKLIKKLEAKLRGETGIFSWLKIG